ncbi:ParM/StbA family protein [Candidatus Ventrimonas sp. KK005]
MVNTMDFRTKSLLLETEHVGAQEFWPVALDIGYSSVKGFSPNMLCAFPSYAKNLGKNPTLYGEQDKDEILYRDRETGEIWRVGRSAQKMVGDRDTSDSQMELFGRDRYFSQMFKILIRTGLALCTVDNPSGAYNKKPILVQTGLPPAYLEEDRNDMVNAIAGRHRFAIKTGSQKHYVNLELEVLAKNVDVMSQPEGTLMSIVTDDQAGSIAGAKRYFHSNVMILDAGFGTLDPFDICNRTIHSRETFSEFGMREVLSRTSRKIKERIGFNLRPTALQNSLETGMVTVKKRNGIQVSSREEGFADLLEEASREVCREAVEKLMNTYSGMFAYDYLILTGGTSAAWEPYIREYFKDMDRLSVVMGNENCPDTDVIFCNVRGYYMYLINSIRRRLRKQGGQ